MTESSARQITQCPTYAEHIAREQGDHHVAQGLDSGFYLGTRREGLRKYADDERD